MNIIKLLSFFFLALLFSTNYYGGNSLFFLDEHALYIVRIVSGVLGFVLLLVYFSLVIKHERDLIHINGITITKKTLEKLTSNNVDIDNVGNILSTGTKKIKKNYVYYSGENNDGLSITIVVNKNGCVVDMI